jgi:hypothetical protein
LEPKNLHFGGGAAESAFNPIVLLLVLVVGVLVVLWPRAKTIAPFIAASVLIPIDQVLVVGGMHFSMMRLLALFGIVRLMREKFSSKTKIFSGGFNKIDFAVISYALSVAVAGVLLFRQMGAFIFQVGNLYTAFGFYFLLRFMIRDKEDILRMVRALAWISPVIALAMAWEVQTGHSPFALLGGSKAAWYGNLMEREGRFRALGCFGHPLLAGTFGAIVLPMFVLLWLEGKKYRTLAAVAIASTGVIIVTSNSSTPILAYAGGILALCLWPLRNWMRATRWGIVFSLLCVQVIWKQPVWYLIAKVDLSGGSSSWHRFALIDQCIRHFGDWWLIGVKSTEAWGWDMWDTANQYVGICDASGLLAFLLFLSILVYGFKYLGRARRIVREKKQKLFLWVLGASLFANVISFFGISYWDQTVVVWYGLLAAIPAAIVIRSDFPKVSLKDTETDADWSEELTGSAARVERDPIEVDSMMRDVSEPFLAN